MVAHPVVQGKASTGMSLIPIAGDRSAAVVARHFQLSQPSCFRPSFRFLAIAEQDGKIWSAQFCSALDAFREVAIKSHHRHNSLRTSRDHFCRLNNSQQFRRVEDMEMPPSGTQ